MKEQIIAILKDFKHGKISVDTAECQIEAAIAEMPTEEEAISRLLDEYYMTKINTDEEKKKFKISVIKFTTWFRNRMSKPNNCTDIASALKDAPNKQLKADINNWDTTSPTAFRDMFRNCEGEENTEQQKQCMYCEKTIKLSEGIFICKECSE